MGSSESTPSKNQSDDKTLRDPLVSSLSRRRKRKLGHIEDISDTDTIYKKMKDIPENLPSHLQKCLDYHKTKPWLGKKVKHTLIAYPSVGMNPPTDIKVFFSNIPHKPIDPKEKQEMETKGRGYIWYMPTKFLWKAHCYVQHQKDSQISCSAEKLIRTFTDTDGNTQSFIFSVVYDDGTFEILTERHFKKECEWWKEQSDITGTFGQRKTQLKTKLLDTHEGRVARKTMKSKIGDIFKDIGKSVDSKYIEDLDGYFVDKNKSQGKNTIYDYVENCIRILIFLDPKSPLSTYTTTFKNKVVRGYFNLYSIPYLTTEDMFPEYYARSASGSIEKVKNWITAYLIQEIEDFFEVLVVVLEPTLSRPVNVRGEIDDIPVKTSGIKSIRDYCPEHKDTDEEDIIVYKDDDDTIYCFHIDQLTSRTSDVNPLNPSKNISSDFLKRFDMEYRWRTREPKSPGETKEEKEEKEEKEDGEKEEKEEKEDGEKEEKEKPHKCSQCAKYIDGRILRTGSVDKDGDDEFKTHLYEFCSSDCLDEYKQLEEIFGPVTPSGMTREEVDKAIAAEREKNEMEKEQLSKKYIQDMEDMKKEYNTLQDKVIKLEDKINKTEEGRLVMEADRDKLKSQIEEKEKLVEQKENELQNINREMASKIGLKAVRGIDDILNGMGQKIKYNNELEEEKKRLEEVIRRENAKIDTLSKTLVQNEETIERTKLDEKKYREKSIALENQLNQVRQEVLDASKKIEEETKIAMEKIKFLENEKEELNTKIKTLSESNIQKDIDMMSKLKEKDEEIQRQIATLESTCKSNMDTIETDKNRSMHTVKKLEASLKTQQDQFIKLKIEMKSKNATIKKLQDEINILNSKLLKIPTIRNNIAELNNVMATQGDDGRLSFQIAKLTTELENLEQQAGEKSSLEKQLADLEGEKKKLEGQLVECSSKDQIGKLKDEIEMLNRQKDQDSKLLDEYKNGIADVNLDREKLSVSIQSLNNTIAEKDVLLRNLQHDIEQKNKMYEDRLKALEGKDKTEYEDLLKKHEDQLKDRYEKKMNELNDINKKLQSEIEDLRKKKDKIEDIVLDVIVKGNDEELQSDKFKEMKSDVDNIFDKIEAREDVVNEIDKQKEQLEEDLEKQIEDAKRKCEESMDTSCKGDVTRIRDALLRKQLTKEEGLKILEQKKKKMIDANRAKEKEREMEKQRLQEEEERVRRENELKQLLLREQEEEKLAEVEAKRKRQRLREELREREREQQQLKERVEREREEAKNQRPRKKETSNKEFVELLKGLTDQMSKLKNDV